jgi:hypothetical protein
MFFTASSRRVVRFLGEQRARHTVAEPIDTFAHYLGSAARQTPASTEERGRAVCDGALPISLARMVR